MDQAMANPKQKGEITGKHVLAALVVFFGIVIATNVVFVRLAVTTFPGEEVKKSYYQGLNYNDVLSDKAQQAEDGWRMQLVAPPHSGAEAVLEVRLLDHQGRPIFGADLTGDIVRPMTDRGRQNLSFDALPDGLYRARLQGLEKGAWDLALVARETGTETVRLSATTRLLVP